jgi:hypothetical protein
MLTARSHQLGLPLLDALGMNGIVRSNPTDQPPKDTSSATYWGLSPVLGPGGVDTAETTREGPTSVRSLRGVSSHHLQVRGLRDLLVGQLMGAHSQWAIARIGDRTYFGR